MTLKELNETLLSCDHTIVVENGNKVFTSHERGVKPLLYLLTSDATFLRGASVADKVVGKAAALLMALGEIKEVHTGIISEPAIEVFENHNITYSFDKKVKRIVNRTGDGLCPMETLCIDVENPREAFEKIRDFIKR